MLLGYTVLVLGTIKLKNNTNHINSRSLTKVFFHFLQKKDYHHQPIPRGNSTFQNWLLITVTNLLIKFIESVNELNK